MKDFTSRNPIVLLFYFVCILILTMLSFHPVIILLSFMASLGLYAALAGTKTMLKSLCYSVPLTLMLTVLNPVFVHSGKTILFFLNEHPYTLEALLFGFFGTLLIMAVFYWFKSHASIMSSDKTVYLFGRVLPRISLIISLALGFIPKMKRKYKEIDDAQRALGMYALNSYVDKLRAKMRILSILITDSLENSVVTADSMRARGYGLKGRSSYAIFKWSYLDTLMTVVIALLFLIGLVLMMLGFANFNYYPTVTQLNWSIQEIMLLISFSLLAIVATFAQIKEAVTWKIKK